MRLTIFILLLKTSILFSQGLNFITEDQLSEIDRFESDNLGFAGNLPLKYSLEKYVPPVNNQYKTSTCVGFSMGYYGMSTIHNIYFNRTNEYEKYIHTFDPYYAYTLNDDDCDEGLDMSSAFRNYATYGAKKNYSPVFVSCDNPVTEKVLSSIDQYLRPYQLEKFEFIQTRNSRSIENIKTSLVNKMPVIIGANITESLFDVEVDSTGDAIWRPRPDEESAGGHAMCLIGYDDTKNGGSFRIVNSWGKDWGDGGYFWVSYADFIAFVSEAYVIRPYKLDLEKKQQSLQFYENYVSLSTEDDLLNYEGEYNNGEITGFGIMTDRKSGFASVGRFIKASPDGLHLIVKNDEILKVQYENGEVIEIDELGFAEEESDFDKQLKRLDPLTEIKSLNRKAIDSIRKASPVGRWKIRPPKKQTD